ncbi:hypothetical protein GCM10011414_22450 [Croceivirga lutea]|uniref:MauE/DoxX family redox-associated membrane protein n=1 Tax=Croceivirga lutea TaxID=1775167 RepID=UPI00163AAB58|nr:MauE/DoxX family redox-associated membrane protein [Croceivirga lutea]GGG52396.1 hypothetical protein GCM10011414_22450 [Croceivirga lutea]
MKTIKLIICVLFGLMFLLQGLNKLFNFIPMEGLTEEQLAMFGHLQAITWLMPLVGVAEIVSGVLFIVPKFRALGALIALPVTVGIILHHLVLEPAGLVVGVILFAVNIWIIAANWSKYRPIWS